MIVNAAAIPFQVFIWIGKMFSCIPFGAKGWIVTVLLSMTMIPVDCLKKIFVWLWKIGEVFMMKIVVAIDSLKGSLTSIQAGEAIEKRNKKVDLEAEVVIKPLADGGEGTVDALVDGMGGKLVLGFSGGSD